MPANRRQKRRKKASSEAGAYFSVEYEGRAKDGEALLLVIEQALKEAYGDVGGAQHEYRVDGFEDSASEKNVILHIPDKEQRAQVWVALTMFHDNQTERFIVRATSDSKEGLMEEQNGLQN